MADAAEDAEAEVEPEPEMEAKAEVEPNSETVGAAGDHAGRVNTSAPVQLPPLYVDLLGTGYAIPRVVHAGTF
jgi:hypothetical protein